MGLQVLLFSLTPRLYFARTVLISSLCLISINIQWILAPIRNPAVMWVMLYVLIIIHHIASFMYLKFFYGIFDLILLLIEIGGVILYALAIPIRSWIPETLIFHAVLVWGTFGSLVFLAIFRLATIIRSRGHALVTPFNILSDQSPSDKKPTLFAMVMGRSIWKLHFVGETRKVIVIRGLLGLLFLATILFWILTSVIYEPMKETALGPVKELRTRTPPIDFVEDIDYPIWNILFPVALNNNTPLISQDAFDQSVDVLAIWSDYGAHLARPACESGNSSIYEYSNLMVYRFRCLPIKSRQTNSILLPDLLVTVNFTTLGAGPALSNPTSVQRAFPVVIGMTDNEDSVKHILERTIPTVLIPDINIAASIIPDIRQIFAHSALAALGIFQVSTTFWDSRIVAMYPDPLVIPATNTSTLRLFWQDNWSETRIIQDYRENSVIAGFSDVGGLWTTLSGFFTIIFGASMLHILYGAKPLSIFGVAHSFQYQHMKEETLRLYPNIIEEHRDEKRRGLLALLHDHLIDLNFLEKEYHFEPKPVTDLEQPPSEKVEKETDPTIIVKEADDAAASSPSISS